MSSKECCSERQLSGISDIVSESHKGVVRSRISGVKEVSLYTFSFLSWREQLAVVRSSTIEEEA